jgi:hypothetical protein
MMRCSGKSFLPYVPDHTISPLPCPSDNLTAPKQQTSLIILVPDKFCQVNFMSALLEHLSMLYLEIDVLQAGVLIF